MLHYKEEWVWLNKFGKKSEDELMETLGYEAVCLECGMAFGKHKGIDGYVVCLKDSEEYSKIINAEE